jgi:thioredoxin reductase
VVAVIGGGNSALDAALMMGEIASQVYLINKNPAFKGETVLIDKALSHPKIKVIYEANTTKILGDKFVTGLEYQDKNKKTRELEVQGVFINIGYFSNSGFIEGVAKDPGGQIMTNQVGATNLPGLYAAGDVTNVPFKQIAIATGMGVLAVLSAIDYINKFPKK